MVGRYQLGRQIGVGVLGPSFDAWHLDRHATGVVKLLTLDGSRWDRLVAERAVLQRLQRLGALSHPGLVPLRDVGPCDEGVYVACEHLPGRTLEVRLASGWRMPARDAFALVEAIVETLVAAQSHGLVHGNLHAGNIVLDDAGHPHIMDLGLVQAAGGRARIDSEPLRLGDRACRAPELRATGIADEAIDTYAVGALLYRLLVEEATFDQAARARLASAGAEGHWTPLSALRPDLPPALCAWVSHALSGDPNERPALGAGLPRVFASTPPLASAAAVAVTPRSRRHADRRRMLAAGVVLASGATVLWQSPWHGQPPAHDPPPPTVAAAPDPVPEPALPELAPLRLRLDPRR